MRDDAVSVIVSGASAAMALPGYLAHLRSHLEQPLRLLLTASAQRFLQPQAVAWIADEVCTSAAADLNPMEFAVRSRVIAVLPATANILASTALGLAATPAQTVLLAAPGPVLFFPSMNQTMWDRAATRRHVATLRGDGHVVVDPRPGEVFELWRRTAGTGLVLPSPDEVTKTVLGWLSGRGG